MLAADALRDKPVLRGEHVVLRPVSSEHADDFWATLGDPETARLTGTHTRFTREAIDRWVATRPEQTDRLDLAIHRLEDDRFVGELALTELDPDNGSVGIRIALASMEQTGRGYGSDALRTVLAYAFEVVGVHRIHLDVYDFNTAAIRTYERLGFMHEGRLRDALLWDGQWHDALVMAMLAQDWAAK